MTTIGQWLQSCGLPLLEARSMMRVATGCSAAQQITQSHRALTQAQWQQLQDWRTRRDQGEPLAYLLGSQVFFGLDFEVNPDVLIPRPETELLVQLCQRFMKPMRRPHVLELGTGSGIIAVCLALGHPGAEITALDISPQALAVAGRNLVRHGVSQRVQLLHSDWFAALQPALGTQNTSARLPTFDLIVANPPYVAQGDPHLEALRFEPSRALTSGLSGMDAIAHITAQAPHFLRPRGRLFLEHGWDQATSVRNVFHQHDFEAYRLWRDFAGHGRVSSGRIRRQATPGRVSRADHKH